MELDLSHVSVKVGEKTVLAQLDLTCRPGEVTGLVGVSGAGKTTALHCLGLLVAPDEGEVKVDGVEATKWTDRQRRAFWRDHAAFIFQDYGLVDDETVGYNVGIGQRAGRRGSLGRQRIAAALEAVGLEGRGTEIVSRLSGGEKQRVGLARAVAKEAMCIFADEPTASLDAQNRAMVIRLLRERAQAGATVVLATHDEQAMAACDNLIQLTATID